MYQAPAATTTQRAPARPKFYFGKVRKLQVTQDLFYAAEQAKRSRRMCWLVDAGYSELTGVLSTEDCDNCGGFGHLALEVAMGGPFDTFPNVKGANGTADKEPAVLLRPASHNGRWYLVVRDLYPCPVCNNNRVIDL